MARSRRPQQNKKKATVQKAITADFLPLLKAPDKIIGKTFKVSGEHWGSSCQSAQEATKLYVCAVKDFTFTHRSTPEDTPSAAFFLSELGEDGQGGNSVDFWMKYPTPMLKYWYATYPDELAAAIGQQNSNAANAEVDSEEAQKQLNDSMKKSRSSVFEYLEEISSERVATGKQRGRIKHIYKCCVMENGKQCGSPVTIYGKSTTPFFKHVRHMASKQGMVGHHAVCEVVNKASCRQVQLSDGTWVAVYSFEEAFPHHVDFVWLVAGGLPIRLNARPAFLDFVRGYEVRAVMPHHETVHRIVECIDSLQRQDLDRRIQELLKKMDGLPCLGSQLDMWTDRNTGICYAAFHITSTTVSDDALELHDDLLDFSSFPYTEHTSANIKAWITELCVKWHIPLTAFSGVTPDGAADGVKAIKLINELKNSFDVCSLHQLQRSILYAIGLAGAKHNCLNRSARDLLVQHKRVVQLSHQSRQISDGFRDEQLLADIPPHKVLSTVRTNATRWGNQKAQITRNILMRPIQDAVLTRYKREHIGETVLLENDGDPDDYATEDDESPRSQFASPTVNITRRDVGITSEAWNASLELEGFLERPWEIKQLIEKCPYLTGAQMIFLMISLRKNSKAGHDLRVKTFPASIRLEHRNRPVATIKGDSIHPMIVTARKVLCEQLEHRFLQNMPSPTRLVQLYMSKQADATKLLPPEWLEAAKAFYLVWLRKAAESMGHHASTTSQNHQHQGAKKQRRMMLFDCLDGDDTDDEQECGVPHPSMSSSSDGATNDDPVLAEVQRWKSLAPSSIAPYIDKETGMVNELRLLFSLRNDFPYHFMVFRQTVVHVPHEANAEDTFSLSGSLSNENTHTGTSFLSSLTRIQRNKQQFKPTAAAILNKYLDKYSAPKLGEDAASDADDVDAAGDDEDPGTEDATAAPEEGSLCQTT